MTTITAYANDGECLGDDYVDLSKLQKDTRMAILQLIYLDELVDAQNELLNSSNGG